MAVKVIEEAKDGLANTGKNFTDNITKKFESTNSAKKPSIGIDDVLQQKPDKIPEQKPKEVPKQKPNETPEQNTKKPSETDDIITVERGNSGVNGSGVKISGEKPNSNVDDIKTRETSNSTGNTEKPKETNNNTSNSNAADTNNAKPIIDIEFQNAAQIRVKELRNQLPNSDLRKYGNVATADVDIAGIKKEFYAHSKINSFEDKGSNIAEFSYLKSESERNFSSYKIDRYPRYHDTEAKILEDIASQIKEPNISGTINLFTERPPCESCSNIIEEFKEKFPNIELNVFSEKGKWIDLKKKGEKS